MPTGYTEAQVVATITHLGNVMAPSFVFGAYSVADIKQEIALFCLEALPRYDPDRPLENFLRVHCQNRLTNLVRDKFRRSDPPCRLCHKGREFEHADHKMCEPYKVWKDRNDAKSNLAKSAETGPREPIHDDRLDEAANAAEIAEAVSMIDASLPTALRADYLRMKAGEKIPRDRRLAVEAAVKEILGIEGEA